MKRLALRAVLVLAPVLVITAFGLSRLGSWLVVEDPLEKADAIVVLGGTLYERPLEAVDLFHAGWAPRIYLLKEIADFGELELVKRGVPYQRMIDLQIDTLRRLGVPADAIHAMASANSTADEADLAVELARRERLARIIFVTSKQHTRRARLVMNRRLSANGVQVIMRASRYDLADTDRWWRNRSTLRFTLFESQRLFGYWIGAAD